MFTFYMIKIIHFILQMRVKIARRGEKIRLISFDATHHHMVIYLFYIYNEIWLLKYFVYSYKVFSLQNQRYSKDTYTYAANIGK